MGIADSIAEAFGILSALVTGYANQMFVTEINVDSLLIWIDVVPERTVPVLRVLLEDDRTDIVPYAPDDVQIAVRIVDAPLRE